MRRRRRSASRRASRKFRSTGEAAAPVPAGTPGAITEAFKAGTAYAEINVPALGEEYMSGPPSSPNQPPPASVGSGTGGLY